MATRSCAIEPKIRQDIEKSFFNITAMFVTQEGFSSFIKGMLPRFCHKLVLINQECCPL